VSKKPFLVLLAFALSLQIVPTHAAVKITPGTKCSKAGSTAVYAGKKYTCIKLGAKLYWDNGKVLSSLDAIAKLPATCTISVPQWRSVPENRPPWQGGQTGRVYFSSLIVNSSLSNVATNVRITAQWYDASGLSYKKSYRISKIYPGAIPFGFIEGYSDDDEQYPTEPLDITLSSTCSSAPLGKSELINGDFPVIKGKAPIEIRTDEEEAGYPIVELIANLVITNSLKKDLILSSEGNSGNATIYGHLKDNLGNVLGGFTSRLNKYETMNFDEISSGETAKIGLQIDFFWSFPSDKASLRRFTVFEYVIIFD